MAAVVVGLLDVVVADRGPEFGQDFRVVWLAGRHVLHGQAVYAPARLPFVYPPTAAVLAVPAALLPLAVAQALFVAALLVCVAVAAVHAVRFSGRRGTCVAPVAVLAVGAYEPAAAALANLNVSGLLAPVVPVYLERMLRGRYRSAGALLGVSFAVKPLLLPLLVVPLLLRRPRALLLPVSVAAALTVLSLPVLPDRARFFTTVVPALLGHGPSPLGAHNISVHGLFVTYGWRTDIADGIRLLVAVLAVAAAVAVWRGAVPVDLRLAEVTGVLFVGFFLANATNENHYLLVLLPLIATLLHPRSQLRHLVTAAAVALIATARPLPGSGAHGFALSQVAGQVLLLLGALVAALARRRTGRSRPTPGR